MAQSQGIMHLHLYRDGPNTPWGFRMTGGVDVGSPLVVQRVFMGSPSEAEMQRGDVILKLRDKETNGLSHKAASEIIRSAGNNIKIVVFRPSLAMTSPPGTPGIQGQLYNPLTNNKGKMYHFATTNPVAPQMGDYFRPLPTTQFQNGSPAGSLYGSSVDSTETNEVEREKKSITKQAFRTTPLITPTAKTLQDCPTGSYLRYVHDPGFHKPSGHYHPLLTSKLHEAVMLSKVQETILGAANSPRGSLSPGRSPTPDSVGGPPRLVHMQYNSPINLYSPQNAAAEALNITQTIPPLSRSPSAYQKAIRREAESPPDICTSPTYQLIHEQEWKDIRAVDLSEHKPVPQKVHDFRGQYDIPREKIQQSGSFRTLMTSMSGITEF